GPRRPGDRRGRGGRQGSVIPGRRRDPGAGRARVPSADRHVDPAATARVRDRVAPRVRRRQAPESREERNCGVTCFLHTGADNSLHSPLRRRLPVRLLSAFAVVTFASSAVASDPVITWKKVVLDPKFRSEGVAAFDVNNDGKKDVANGEYWYEAPNW